MARQFNGRPLTREEVLIAREAYENGLIRGSACEFSGREDGMKRLKEAVREAFPFPSVTRPRVIAVDESLVRLGADGVIEYSRDDGKTWRPCPRIVAEARAVIDLLANPTEEVESDA